MLQTGSGGARPMCRVSAAAGLLICAAGRTGRRRRGWFRTARAIHVLNRLAFGPTLEEFRLRQDDRRRALHRRAARSRIDPGADRAAMAARPARHLEAQPGAAAPALRAAAQLCAASSPHPELEKAQRERVRIILRDAGEARILRALLSRRQLQEVMVDFWFNHFNVFSGKGLDDVWIGNYEQQAIRPFALGRFRDLLFATAKHPAMLVYLDNALSTRSGQPGRARQTEPGSTRISRARSWSCTRSAPMAGTRRRTSITLARILTGWGVNRAGCARVSRSRRGLRRRAP